MNTFLIQNYSFLSLNFRVKTPVFLGGALALSAPSLLDVHSWPSLAMSFLLIKRGFNSPFKA
jgi:hypothetical protein